MNNLQRRRHMSRRLKVADYMFVKRIAGVEFVVPLLIERKRMDGMRISFYLQRGREGDGRNRGDFE